MVVTGVIAEYNPFHQGHALHLSYSRTSTNADYIIVVMSGNYVQRGTLAMFDKYTRAHAALKNGADLVLELPPAVSTASAEYFAKGAVALLEDTGIVTDLCFGSECGALTELMSLASFLAEETEEYQFFLRQELKKGSSYPKARTEACRQCGHPVSQALLSEPNNLLGIEYLKALIRTKSSVRPHTLKRLGAHYHTQSFTKDGPASASAMRAMLLQNHGAFTPEFLQHFPSREIYQAYEGKSPLTEDALSLLLIERLRRNPQELFQNYFDVTEELSNRIKNCQDDFQSFSQFTDLLKTKNLTRTFVSRALLHILLYITAYEPSSVLRVLGFRQDAAVLLQQLTRHGRLPLVMDSASSMLSPKWLYADRLYESVRSYIHQTPYQKEGRRKMLVV